MGISPCVQELEPYEFRYCLKEWEPETGWQSVALDAMAEMEVYLGDRQLLRAYPGGTPGGGLPLSWIKRSPA